MWLFWYWGVAQNGRNQPGRRIRTSSIPPWNGFARHSIDVLSIFIFSNKFDLLQYFCIFSIFSVCYFFLYLAFVVHSMSAYSKQTFPAVRGHYKTYVELIGFSWIQWNSMETRSILISIEFHWIRFPFLVLYGVGILFFFFCLLYLWCFVVFCCVIVSYRIVSYRNVWYEFYRSRKLVGSWDVIIVWFYPRSQYQPLNDPYVTNRVPIGQHDTSRDTMREQRVSRWGDWIGLDWIGFDWIGWDWIGWGEHNNRSEERTGQERRCDGGPRIEKRQVGGRICLVKSTIHYW